MAEDCLISPVQGVKLKDYQERAVKHLIYNRGLIAAFGTGTGKTITAVAAINCFIMNNKQGKVIFIASVSLVANIIKELSKYGLDINKAPLKGRMDIYTYSKFQKMMEDSPPIDCNNAFFIVDEAHTLSTKIQIGKEKSPTDGKKKESEVKGWTALHAIQCAAKASKVLLLTATPAYNAITDVVNLITMVDGQPFPLSYTAFSQDIASNPRLLEELFKCKITFHEKEESGDFPGRVEHMKYFMMSPLYYKNYLQIQLKESNIHLKDKFGDPNKFKFFYHALRRAVNDLDETESPKIQWLIDQLTNEIKKGNKSIVFSNWLNSGIKKVMEKLDPSKIKFGFIAGNVAAEVREKIKLDFNSGKLQVLFLSNAGGEGLDLMETANVYIMESNWNVNTEEQVIGRAIRFKSHSNLPPEKRVVNIYRLIMKKPIIRASNDDEPESIDEVLYKHSHIKKQPVLNTLINTLKPMALENNRCNVVRINTEIYKRLKENLSYEELLARKIKQNEEKKIEQVIKKDKKDEKSPEITDEDILKEERQKKLYEQKKKMLTDFNKDYIGRKKSVRRSKEEREEGKQEKEKKEIEKKEIGKKAEELLEEARKKIQEAKQKREQASPYKSLIKCYNYFVDNNIWSSSKEEYDRKLNEFFLENTPEKIASNKDKQELVKAIKKCSDEIKDHEEFVKIINKELKTTYLPDSVKDKSLKTLEKLYKAKTISLDDKFTEIENSLYQYGNINKDYSSPIRALIVDWKVKKNREERRQAGLLEEEVEEKKEKEEKYKEEDEDKQKKQVIKKLNKLLEEEKIDLEKNNLADIYNIFNKDSKLPTNRSKLPHMCFCCFIFQSNSKNIF